MTSVTSHHKKCRGDALRCRHNQATFSRHATCRRHSQLSKKQYATEAPSTPEVDKDKKKFIQQVCGKFLFYGRAVDSTVLTPISAIASQSAKPTETTYAQTKQLLDYLATQEDAILTYNKSDMVLAVHSDASYLCKPKARSRAGGHFFMSANTTNPPNNGAILNIAHVIKNVMSYPPPKQN